MQKTIELTGSVVGGSGGGGKPATLLVQVDACLARKVIEGIVKEEKQALFAKALASVIPALAEAHGVELRAEKLPAREVIEMARSWASNAVSFQALGCYPLPITYELIAALASLGDPERQDGFPPLNFPPKPFKQDAVGEVIPPTSPMSLLRTAHLEGFRWHLQVSEPHEQSLRLELPEGFDLRLAQPQTGRFVLELVPQRSRK